MLRQSAAIRTSDINIARQSYVPLQRVGARSQHRMLVLRVPQSRPSNVKGFGCIAVKLDQVRSTSLVWLGSARNGLRNYVRAEESWKDGGLKDVEFRGAGSVQGEAKRAGRAAVLDTVDNP